MSCVINRFFFLSLFSPEKKRFFGTYTYYIVSFYLYYLPLITDIGANLTDEVFDGRYSGSRKHDADRQQVLEKAWQIGMQKIIVTVGTIFDCEPAFKIANTDERIFCTVGKENCKHNIIMNQK